MLAVLATACASSYLHRAPPSPREPWPLPAEPARASGPFDRAPPIAHDHDYSLPELIDLAESTNPDTRIGWEHARQAALGVGEARAEYFPTITGKVILGYEQFWSSRSSLMGATVGTTPFSLLPSVQRPLPDMSSQSGARLWQVLPFIHVSWNLFDPGRAADVRSAESVSVAANALFTAEHEKVMFDVASAYFRLNAARAQVAVSRETLDRTRVIADSADARYGQGLATVVETAEARRDVAQAEYNVKSAEAAVIVAHAALVTALGVDPEAKLGVADRASGPLPAHLEQPVTAYVQQALTSRADLRAAQARLPATAAGVSRHEGKYLPRVSVDGLGGGAWLGAARLPTISLPNYGVFLNLDWTIYDGGLREVQIEIARSQNEEAVQELAKLDRQVVAEVITAYNEATASLSRYQSATALLDASTTAAAAASDSYKNGLITLGDAVNAEGMRALAAGAKEQAFADALIAMTKLAYASGELLTPKAVPHPP
jgi:outer membrane protein TolC